MMSASMSILPGSPVSPPLKLGASDLVGRPSLMLPPSFVEEGKLEYKFYSPLKKNNRDKGGFGYNYCFSPLKQDLLRLDKRHKQQDEEDVVRLDNSGGKEELDLMQDKGTKWVGSSHGWLVLFNKNNRIITLLNPVSGRSIQLPPFREPFLDKDKKIPPHPNPFMFMLSLCNKHRRPYPLKVILSHSPADEKCRAIAIYSYFQRAVCCSPGRSERWSPLGLGRSHHSSYMDFVYCASRKAFVSVNETGFLFGTEDLDFWDPSSTMEAPVKTLGAPPVSLFDPRGFTSWTYLVSEEESGQLFMVKRYKINDTRVDYVVYGIHNHNGREVVQLHHSLDDLVMFVGINRSFAVKASRFPEYKPNCIYFSGTWYNDNQRADIFDYNNKAYSQLFDDFSPDQKWPFHSTLPWFTLTHTSSVSTLELDWLL